ncbi:BTAD domain-containing putative transcriptional regulator [Plantactinospora sp. GCM10030261]|uniref:AfsR/SARP family transcriptional regulator n=1 Tax=Plantactinospora sp. GCM10030261 TaxID=3273420 RepID=UPI00360B6A6C
MELRVLGEMQVLVDGQVLDLGPPKQRLVFAALAIDVGRNVPIEVLVDRVWDDTPPADARGVLYTYLTRIRRILAAPGEATARPVTVSRGHSGYLLEADPDRVDLHRLRRLAGQAQELAEDHPDRTVMLREAIDLWRGEPLDGLPGGWAERVREGLRKHLVQVLLDWADSEMRQGHPARVADRLAQALDRSPLTEPLVLNLMRALLFSGRRAEALALYARTRTLLADELGVEPGAELRELHRDILRDNLRRPVVAAVRASTAEPPAPPEPEPAGPPRAGAPGCQLPADLPDHIGCEPEISCALSVLQPAGRAADGTAGPVVILSGPGGVGKTALSVRLAYLLRRSYPDGQIFVTLGGRNGDSVDALDRVLRALGVPNVQQLRTMEDKLGQYRSMLSGRRILIVLDSAASAEEVRPLVPGGPGSALIVSSRAMLTTVPGAEHIEVPLLTRADSMALLERIVGVERVVAEPEAATELAGMCAGLPLALRIVGARIAARRHRRIARLADRMRDERGRLDEMAADGLAVRVSVGIGYQALEPAVRKAFRLLGFLGATDFSGWLAAALTGHSLDTIEELLEQLCDARLVTAMVDPTSQVLRYQMHDLVRLFAHERAVAEHTDGDLRAAVARVLMAGTELCERLGQRLPYAVPPLYRQAPMPIDLEPAVLAADHSRAGWLETEAPCLIAAVERAADLGLDIAACALADALVFASFAVRNDFLGWNRTHAAALTAARKAGNAVGEAVIACGIALLRYKEDRFVAAERSFRDAVELFDAAGHEHGAAAARNGLGTVLREVGRHREAVPLITAAADTLSRLNDENGAAHAVYGLGHCHRELGEDEVALARLTEAIDRYRALGNWRGEAIGDRGVGMVHRARGELAEAERWCARAHEVVTGHDEAHLACYTMQALAKVWFRQGDVARPLEPLDRALRTCRRLHDKFGEALVLRTIGELHLAGGRPDEAFDTLTVAYDSWRVMDHDLGMARTLRDLGAVHAARNDVTAAHAAWEAAASTFRRLGTREYAEAPGWHRRWGCGCVPADPVPSATNVVVNPR